MNCKECNCLVPYKRTTLVRVARDHTDVITVLSFRHDRKTFFFKSVHMQITNTNCGKQLHNMEAFLELSVDAETNSLSVETL
jgi:hypothetical protein